MVLPRVIFLTLATVAWESMGFEGIRGAALLQELLEGSEYGPG